jgi:hypothetical protein
MKVFKGSTGTVCISLYPTDGADEVGAVIRALVDRNERCQVAKGIRGGPRE